MSPFESFHVTAISGLMKFILSLKNGKVEGLYGCSFDPNVVSARNYKFSKLFCVA